MLAEHIDDKPLRAHELHHIAQIDRDGPLKFWPKIIFDYVWYGHDRSPYEIEARKVEEQVRQSC